MKNMIEVGCNANRNEMSNKYAHEHPEFAEIRVTRAVATTRQRHRLAPWRYQLLSASQLRPLGCRSGWGRPMDMG
jgi:hypothetical protein